MKIYDSQHSNLAVSAVGGKALNLYRLLELGLNVPNFAVLDQENLVNLIPTEIRTVENYPAILEAIDNYNFPPNFLSQLANSFENPENKRFAVRSSQ